MTTKRTWSSFLIPRPVKSARVISVRHPIFVIDAQLPEYVLRQTDQWDHNEREPHLVKKRAEIRDESLPMGDPKDGDAVRYSLENHFQHLCLQLVAEVGGVVLEETLESPYEEWRGACQRRNKCIAPYWKLVGTPQR